MKPLPTALRKGGFDLTLVSRRDTAAIYRQHWPSGNPDNDVYEVVLPRVFNTDFRRQPVESYESYPASEEWGKRGWTYVTLADAQEKLEKLDSRQKAVSSIHVTRRNRFVAAAGSAQREQRQGAVLTRLQEFRT